MDQRRIDYLLDTLPDQVDASFVHEASPERIERRIGIAEAERRDLEALISWLRELQAVRATQVRDGEWPPKPAAPPPEPDQPTAQIVDLMQALKDSLAQAGPKKSAS